MANKMASLAKDTAIYGISSIVGRFLNYLLMPIHTMFIEPGGYGIVSNLYAYAGLLAVLLTFGMETTFFRFASKQDEDPRLVYGTALRLVGGVGLVFLAAVLTFLNPISSAMGYSGHPEYIACFAIIGSIDAFQAIMFSQLRQQHRPIKFMALKMAFIIPNVLLNIFVFWIMPKMFGTFPRLQEIYTYFNDGVGLIFFINLACTAIVTLGFTKEIRGITFGFSLPLARRMLRYAWPIMLFGLVGILNQVFDKIAYPYLVPGQKGRYDLGIYGACVKIAMIMSLLTQAFRYAYEPFVFSNSKEKDSSETLAQGMKYFVIFALLAFLAVMFYMPLLKYFVVKPEYRVGLNVIPIVMVAEIFMGIYFNLSFWYKLTDKTWWGAVISGIGAAVMITVNVIFVPRIAQMPGGHGYMASAWGGVAGYGTCMLLSYFLGQKHSPVSYPLGQMLVYLLLAAALYAISIPCRNLPDWAAVGIGTLLLCVYLAYLIRKDLPLRSLPVIGKYFS